MTEVCPRCLMAFPHHLVIRARCEKRWRGSNFDKAGAEGNIGAALAGLWGIDARSQAGLEALLTRALIRSYGERREENPTWNWDSSAGEDFEFHVGLRFDPGPEEVARVRETVEKAIASSRHFALAEPTSSTG